MTCRRNNELIDHALQAGMKIVVPPKRNRKHQREYDKHLYKVRRLVENTLQKDNPAVRFYKRLDYEVADEKTDHAGHEDYIMIKELGE